MREYILWVLLIAALIGGFILYVLVDKQKSKLEQTVNDLLTNMPGGVFQFKLDELFTIIDVDDKFLDIIGYSKKNLLDEVSESLAKIVFISDLDTFKVNIQKQVQNKDNINMSVRIIKRNGSLVWVSIKGHVYMHNEETFVRGVAIDISDIKEHPSSSFNHIFDNVTIGIFFVSSNNYSVKNFNPFALKSIGISDINETFIDKIIYEDDLEDFKNAIIRCASTNKNVKIMHRFKNNKNLWVETTLNGNAQIGFKYILATFVDVTPSKKLERLVIKKEKELSNFYDFSMVNVIIVDVVKNFMVTYCNEFNNNFFENKMSMNLFNDIVYKDDIDVVKNVIKTTVKDGSFRGFRFRVYDKNNNVTYISGRTELLNKTKSEITIKFVFFSDVT